MYRSSRSNYTPLFVALLAALFIHAPALHFLADWMAPSELEPAEQVTKPMVARLIRREPKKKKKPPVKPQPEVRGTIVDVPDPEKKTKAPEDARFLARKNNDTKKETKAKARKGKASKEKAKTRTKNRSKVQSKSSQSAKPTQLPKRKKQAAPKQAAPKSPLAEKGMLKRSNSLPSPPGSKLLLPSTNEKFALANIQAQSGLSAADDALREIEQEGQETVLKTREFRYWHFFSRVKDRIRKEWRPVHEYRGRDPTGRVYGVKDRYTIIRVTLDTRGDIKKLGISKESGVQFLDEEAWRAFRAAGPFPNPPAGLVDAKGEITFEFGFLFEINSKPRFLWSR